MTTYAPISMPAPKINLSDLISLEEEGKTYLGPNINWEAMPGFLSDLAALLDPSGMMLGTVPFGKATNLKTLPQSDLEKGVKLFKNFVEREKGIPWGQVRESGALADPLKMAWDEKYGPQYAEWMRRIRSSERMGKEEASRLQNEASTIWEAVRKTNKKLGQKVVKPNLLDMELDDALKYMKEEKKEGIVDIAKAKLKDQSGKVSNKPVSISPEERAVIFDKLRTSPEREELLSPERLKEIEDFLVAYKKAYPKGEAHLFGSVLAKSKKQNPGDIDMLTPVGDVAEFLSLNKRLLSGLKPELGVKLPTRVDIVPSPPLSEVPNNMKKLQAMWEKRYGPSGEPDDWIKRILSAMGLLTPLSGLVESEK